MLKPKVAAGVRKAAKKGKKTCEIKFCETLRADPKTPCAAFLDSYNKVEETLPTLGGQ